MSDFYNMDGDPITMEEWLVLFGNRQIDQTDLGDVRVSTVWLGLDHSFGEGPPLIFETMVFGGPLDQEQVRWSTWAAAKTGHQEMVQRVLDPRLADTPRTYRLTGDVTWDDITPDET